MAASCPISALSTSRGYPGSPDPKFQEAPSLEERSALIKRCARTQWGPAPLSFLVAPDWISTGRPNIFTASENKVFLKVFAGRAHLSWTVAKMGVPILAPVKLRPVPPLVPCTDALDPDTGSPIGEWITAGKVGWVHLAPECKTFSRSRNYHDGGPLPLRDENGIILDSVKGPDREKILIADKLVSMTMRVAKLAHTHPRCCRDHREP